MLLAAFANSFFRQYPKTKIIDPSSLENVPKKDSDENSHTEAVVFDKKNKESYRKSIVKAKKQDNDRMDISV